MYVRDISRPSLCSGQIGQDRHRPASASSGGPVASMAPTHGQTPPATPAATMMDNLTQVFAHERERIVRLVNRIVGCPSTAEDIAHDTWLRLSDRCVGREDTSLLFRTAQNLALDHVRAKKVRTDYACQTDHRGDAVDRCTPDHNTCARAELEDLSRALGELPERTRKIFLLQRVDGWTYPEIGHAMGLSTSTIEKEMMSAMRHCREHLQRRRRADDAGDDPPPRAAEPCRRSPSDPTR